MRLLQLIKMAEAKFSYPHEMYHGTSSVNLKSILANGIMPKPQARTYEPKPKEFHTTLWGIESLEGSYWTSNFTTATSGATSSKIKFGGNSLLIIAKISLGSAFADEDSIVFRPLNALQQAYYDITNSNIVIDSVAKMAAYVYWTKDPRYHQPKLLPMFAKRLHEMLAPNEPHNPIDINLAKLVLETIMLKSLAMQKHQDDQSSTYWGDAHIQAYQVLVDKGNAPPIPALSEIEGNVKKVQDLLTKKYRDTVKNPQGQFNHSLRINEPVGYKGNNKIIGIVEKIPTPEKSYTIDRLVLHYGYMSKTVMKLYQERIGLFPGLYTPQGKQLIPRDNKNG